MVEEKSEIEKLKSDMMGLQGALQEQASIAKAMNEYLENSSTKLLNKIDPEILEFLGYWKAMKATKKTPKVFLTPKNKIPKEIKQILKGDEIFLSN